MRKSLKTVVIYIILFFMSAGLTLTVPVYSYAGLLNLNNFFKNSEKFDIEKYSKNRDEYKITVHENIVLIKTSLDLPKDDYNQRLAVYEIISPYLHLYPQKITILWQKDIYSYGKLFSVSKTYINEFYTKKMTKSEFIEKISEKDLTPVNISKNGIAKITLAKVESLRIQKSYELREKGDLYRFIEDYESAIRLYRKSIEYNPDNYLSFYYLGEIFQIKNMPAEAKKYYIRSIQLNPGFKAANDKFFELLNKETFEENGN